MSHDWEIKEGDSLPELDVQIRDPSGDVADLGSVQDVEFRMAHVRSDTLVASASASITDAATGRVQYDISETETGKEGLHAIEWRVTRSSGETYSYPQGDNQTLFINAGVGRDLETAATTNGTYQVGSLEAEQVSYSGPRGNRATLGILGDVHWNNSNGNSNDIQSLSTIKSNLDEFIDEMNAIQPDLVIQMGDLVHGNDVSTSSAVASRVTDARDYLENTGGSAGTGIDAPVEYIYGNHEYEYAGSDGMSEVYSAFGHSGLSDTYRSIIVDGVKLLLTNTAYTETDGDVTPDDHETPSTEVDWIRSELDSATENGTPVIPFVHVPVHQHDGGQSYDATINGPEVCREFASHQNIPMGFFGHVHHGDRGWDRVRAERDRYGRPWLNCPTPNHVHEDTSKHPWQVAMVSPAGAVTSHASYQSDAFSTLWQYNLEQRTPTYKQFVEDNFVVEYNRFNSLDSWSTSGSTSLSTADQGTLTLETTATSGNNSFAIQEVTNSRVYHDLDWGRTVAFRVSADFKNASAQDVQLSLGRSDFADRSANHLGIRVSGGTVYGSVGNGTTETTTQLETVASNANRHYLAVLRDGSRADFYRLGADVPMQGSITSNLPSGQIIGRLFDLKIQTNEAVSKRVDVPAIAGYVGEEPPDSRLGY